VEVKVSFEEFVNSKIVEKFVFEKEINVENVSKLRDSSRVCFLENKVKYENTEKLILDEKVSSEEKVILKVNLEKFLNRSINYLSKYNVVKELLLELRKREKENKENEKLKKVEVKKLVDLLNSKC
jgi:hypothetical protein